MARPLFFEFPTDPQLPALDTQFLIGPALMITPVLTEGAIAVNMYETPLHMGTAAIPLVFLLYEKVSAHFTF